MGRDDFAASAAYQPEPTAVAAARRFVRDTLQEWIITGAAADGHGLVDDAVLLTSELVTNAVVHAGTPVQVVCRLADDEVEVVVSDGDPARLVPESRRGEHDPVERTNGRGLLLPAALASAWGVSYGRAAKAVWFRLGLSGQAGRPDGDLVDGRDGDRADALADSASLAAALRHAPVAGRGGPARGPAAGAETPSGPDADQPASTRAADSGYDDILIATVEAARSAMSADAAYALMADEDGELRLRAAVGGIPGEASDPDGETWEVLGRRLTADVGANDAPPSVVTVPFVVDGRVTGLLAAATGAPGRFGDDDLVRLQRLADRWGPPLERARLSDLERVRRGRLGVLAEARALLAGRIDREEAMALVGKAAVPRLASWCAVLVADEAILRTAFARHASDDRSAALVWLLDQLCGVAGSALAERPPGSAPRSAPGREPVWRWPLAVPDRGRPPAGVDALTGDDAWCFPFGGEDVRGVFVIGHRRHERLPREVTELAADIACRVGIALRGAAKLAGHAG